MKSHVKKIQHEWVLAMLLVVTPMCAPICAQSVSQRASQNADRGINEARVSVERLLKLSELDALAKTPAERNVAILLARERVDMYVTGVRDLGEGRDWCIYRQNILPHEAIDRVMRELRQLTGEARQGNAARAIAAILTKQYSCR